MREKAFGIVETLVILCLSCLILYIAFSGISTIIRNYNKIKVNYLKKLNMESALQIYLSGREPPEEINGQKVKLSDENLKRLQEGE